MNDFTIGLDIGSTMAKGLLLSPEDKIIATLLQPTGHRVRETIEQLFSQLSAACPKGQKPGVIATGYGRTLADCAEKSITEITCHARGVHWLHPGAKTILDIGGQDSKVIRLDNEGRVDDFAMNDRCAAGTGSFLDTITKRFGLSLTAFEQEVATDAPAIEINSTCVVFAETEVVSLLSQGHTIEGVLKGVLRAIARRTVALLRQVKFEGPVYFSGGVAQNETLRRELERLLELPVIRAERAQFTGALGAAILGRQMHAKK